MGEAFAWFGQVVEWIGKFIPRFDLVEMNEHALKTEGFFLPKQFRRFKGNCRIWVCGPGLWWWWPATTKFDKYPTALQTDDLPSQTIETSDGVTVTVAGMTSYRISDLALLLPHCFEPIKVIQTIMLPSIHQVVCRMTWASLTDEQRKGTLNTKLRNNAKRRLAEFGIEVVDVELTDLTRTRAIRLIQSMQQDVG